MNIAETPQDISGIAYAFIGSKVLFASLNLGMFEYLADGGKTLSEIAELTKIPLHQAETLLTACRSLGLISKKGELFENAPACSTYLVQSSTSYFGDYLGLQLDKQVYPLLQNLEAALRGKKVNSLYDLMQDEKEAELFIRAQHSGSLGPAHLLSKKFSLNDARNLLDVAGGSGAFSIALCRRYNELNSLIIDFPNVVRIAQKYVADVGLEDRIRFLPGDALIVNWPSDQDVILLSYLFSALAANDIIKLIRRAVRSLRPGGQILIHDFMVENDRKGPLCSALWFVALMIQPGAISLTPGWLLKALKSEGFENFEVSELIPGITHIVHATKSSTAS